MSTTKMAAGISAALAQPRATPPFASKLHVHRECTYPDHRPLLGPCSSSIRWNSTTFPAPRRRRHHRGHRDHHRGLLNIRYSTNTLVKKEFSVGRHLLKLFPVCNFTNTLAMILVMAAAFSTPMGRPYLLGLSIGFFTDMSFWSHAFQPLAQTLLYSGRASSSYRPLLPSLRASSSSSSSSSSYQSAEPASNTPRSLYSWENIAKATLTMLCLNPNKNDSPLAIGLTIAFSYILTRFGVPNKYQTYIGQFGALAFAVVFTWKGWREKTSKDVLKRLDAMEDKMDVILKKIQ